jgi:hypothetical protein
MGHGTMLLWTNISRNTKTLKKQYNFRAKQTEQLNCILLYMIQLKLYIYLMCLAFLG